LPIAVLAEIASHARFCQLTSEAALRRKKIKPRYTGPGRELGSGTQSGWLQQVCRTCTEGRMPDLILVNELPAESSGFGIAVGPGPVTPLGTASLERFVVHEAWTVVVSVQWPATVLSRGNLADRAGEGNSRRSARSPFRPVTATDFGDCRCRSEYPQYYLDWGMITNTSSQLTTGARAQFGCLSPLHCGPAKTLDTIGKTITSKAHDERQDNASPRWCGIYLGFARAEFFGVSF